jgi:amino acid adenylation domain-containing protein/thioester reductase-like protein
MGSTINGSYRCCVQQQQQDDVHVDDDLFRRDVLFPSLIEVQARLHPSRLCLISSSAMYDFKSLWSLVVVNARRFSQQGVNRRSKVAIVSESSPTSIVALLAVLKVGAVGVPLSSSLPESRIQSIARTGKLTHLIALTTLSQQISLPSVDELTLDLDLRATNTLLELDPLPEVDPQAPAIVIFTSGSSGEPKGVVHSHASLSTMALAVGNALCLAPDERNFLFPSFGWAVNIIDTFATLVAGACLCIPTETEKSQGLEDAICRFDATRMTLPPSVLGILEPSTVPSLTSIVLAGEPMRPDLVLTWSSHVVIYWNYGSSETLMVLAGNAVERESDSLNAGHALPSCRCYILGDNGDELPLGQAGQLIVEGHTNFMGYLRDGKVCSPEHGRSGCVIVRSGDLFEQDGRNAAFVHRGRIDSQLKISGQRFEPQEVENKLWSALTDVKELAVTVASLKGNARGAVLVAVVVLEHKDATSDSSHARLKCSFERLVQTLPPYMIPIGGLEVDKLPRLHNGKLDRKGIIHLAEQRAVTDLMDLRPPQKDQTRDHDIALTSKVALVWARVLGLNIEDIKSSSSFFLLGGNSLYAMRACKELRQIGILMSISDFFLHPTLGEMVHFIAARDISQPGETEQPSQSCLCIPEIAASELHEMAAKQCGVDEGLIENVYPCTPIQAGLMTLSEVQEGTYVAEHLFRLPRSWSKTSFVHAWPRVVNATPILRSRIVRHQNGRMYNATIRFDEDKTLPLEDFPHPFTMACGTQLFLHCLGTDQENDCLTWRWRVHHSVYDRWSTNLILEMIQKEYYQLETMRSTPFSLFARAVAQQELSEKAKDFWHSRLESFTGSVFPQLSREHRVCRASSSITFESSIQRRRSATTQATSIQGALALLISKMHGESDVVFGMTVHGRALSDCPDAETVVGPAIATVPLRIQLAGCMQVHKFLEHVQTQAALMSDYEHYGLRNMKSIGPGSASAASFTTLLIVQPDLESGVVCGPGRIIEINTGSSDSYLDYPFVIECFPHSDGIKVKMLYDSAVFPAWDVQMMAKQFEQLLNEIECYADPSTAIMDLNLVGSENAADVLRMSCGNLLERRECLHERIFAKAKAWKAEDALHGWDARYTYAELDSLVRVLAARLSQGLGCIPGKIVPICYQKSANAVVAMLATLSAGHAFLLLDPALPAQRIKYMVEAVKADRIICSSDTRRHVQHIMAQPINFEDIMNATWSAPECLVDVQSSPERPAYCIFTSGSTGSPKGVLLLHKQVTSGLEAQCDVGLYRRGIRILQFSSYSFDTCIADIFATLLSGGCVCIPNDEEKLIRISENINDFSANTIDLTPSVARMIQPDDVPKLEVLRLGGEPMHNHHIRTWASRCNLQNTYGPTECCVQCTFVDHMEDTMSPSLIGKGIGCNTWVVDPQNHRYLMPLGAVGELAIQGPAVASGYINNQGKSKTSFLPGAPWLETYNIECDFPTYLTGDLVKFNEQGNLVFIGRRDNQIKVGGQRVELEEIEHILQQDPLTDQAVVCYPSTGVLLSQLVAILESSHFNPCSSSSLVVNMQQLPGHIINWMERSAKKAAESLPQYMVPAVYLLADKTLLTSSGKLDRRSMQQWLEQISADELESLNPYQRAKTPDPAASLPDLPESLMSPIVEQIQYLLSWRSGNSQANFSTRHSFSRIGLDSITIVPLLKWVNKTYQAQMDMQTLLRLETVHELACHLHGREAQTGSPNSFGEDHEGFQDIISKGVDQLCRNNNSSDPPRRVLLTGGSSLVGLNILTRLLHQFSSTRVAVLIRCVNVAGGKERLLEKLNLLSSWRNSFTDRIEIWPGDLSCINLGLSPSHWLQLGGQEDSSTHVDVVIHNGASVDWFEGFQTLKKVNVDATLKLVECVRDSLSIKRLVYISGGPQWDPDETEEAVLEGYGLGDAFARSNAYGQTKMITSTIIQRAAARNPCLAAKVAVIRPALVIGSSMDGVPNIDDFIWRVVLGCYAIRAFPQESEGDWVYLCGADSFADMVIQILSAPPRVYERKVNNGLPVEKFWKIVNQELKGQLGRLNYHIWLQRLKENISAHGLCSIENHPCQPILHMIESSPKVLGSLAPQSADAKWHQRMAEESARVVQRNIRYMVDIGCFSKAEPVWSARVFNRSKVR